MLFTLFKEASLSKGTGIVEVDRGLVRVVLKGNGNHLLKVIQSPCYRNNSSTIKDIATEKSMSIRTNCNKIVIMQMNMEILVKLIDFNSCTMFLIGVFLPLHS